MYPDSVLSLTPIVFLLSLLALPSNIVCFYEPASAAASSAALSGGLGTCYQRCSDNAECGTLANSSCPNCDPISRTCVGNPMCRWSCFSDDDCKNSLTNETQCALCVDRVCVAQPGQYCVADEQCALQPTSGSSGGVPAGCLANECTTGLSQAYSELPCDTSANCSWPAIQCNNDSRCVVPCGGICRTDHDCQPPCGTCFSSGWKADESLPSYCTAAPDPTVAPTSAPTSPPTTAAPRTPTPEIRTAATRSGAPTTTVTRPLRPTVTRTVALPNDSRSHTATQCKTSSPVRTSTSVPPSASPSPHHHHHHDNTTSSPTGTTTSPLHHHEGDADADEGTVPLVAAAAVGPPGVIAILTIVVLELMRCCRQRLNRRGLDAVGIGYPVSDDPAGVRIVAINHRTLAVRYAEGSCENTAYASTVPTMPSPPGGGHARTQSVLSSEAPRSAATIASTANAPVSPPPPRIVSSVNNNSVPTIGARDWIAKLQSAPDTRFWPLAAGIADGLRKLVGSTPAAFAVAANFTEVSTPAYGAHAATTDALAALLHARACVYESAAYERHGTLPLRGVMVVAPSAALAVACAFARRLSPHPRERTVVKETAHLAVNIQAQCLVLCVFTVVWVSAKRCTVRVLHDSYAIDLLDDESHLREWCDGPFRRAVSQLLIDADASGYEGGETPTLFLAGASCTQPEVAAVLAEMPELRLQFPHTAVPLPDPSVVVPFGAALLAASGIVGAAIEIRLSPETEVIPTANAAGDSVSRKSNDLVSRDMSFTKRRAEEHHHPAMGGYSIKSFSSSSASSDRLSDSTGAGPIAPLPTDALEDNLSAFGQTEQSFLLIHHGHPQHHSDAQQRATSYTEDEGTQQREDHHDGSVSSTTEEEEDNATMHD